MAKQHAAFRLSPEVLEAIEAKSIQTGQDKTAIVEAALREALGVEVEAVQQPLNNVEQRLDDLQLLFDEVKQLLDQLSLRVDRLEQLTPTAPNTAIPANINTIEQLYCWASEYLSKPATAHPPDLNELVSARSLAKRLGVHHSAVLKRKDKPGFGNWASSKDPEGWSWEYRYGKFHRVDILN